MGVWVFQKSVDMILGNFRKLGALLDLHKVCKRKDFFGQSGKMSEINLFYFGNRKKQYFVRKCPLFLFFSKWGYFGKVRTFSRGKHILEKQ